MAQKVGFIGLGVMGRPFATNIARAAFDLMVFDLQPAAVHELVELGARAASSAREVAEYAEFVDIAVPHEADVDAVMNGPDGLLAGAHAGLIAIIHSSLHPVEMQRVANEAGARGVDVLDAQMSGGPGGVRGQSLCFMVGGKSETLERCRPVLQTTAGTIFHLGDIGMGAATKVAQNTMTALNLMSAIEGFRLAEKMGVDINVFQEVVQTSAAQSHIADAYLSWWAERDMHWGYYPVLRQALELAHTYDVALPGAATCMQELAHSLRKSQE